MKMKKITSLLLCLFFVYQLYGQSRPDQFLLTERYLWGKSKEELRIMRNEIFARYGYIFKSQDLKTYFEKQKWYKPLSENVEDKLTEIDKKNIALILEYEKSKANQYEITTYDSSYSKSMKVRKVNSPVVFHRQVEATYLRHNWKKTVDRLSYGAEEVPTVVKLEYLDESPYSSDENHYWEMEKFVNDIEVFYNYIKTITYSFPENYYEIYPFFSDEPIVKYDGQKCYRIRVPNSDVKSFFIGYTYSKSEKGKSACKIYLSDLSGIINELTIISESGKIWKLDDNAFKISSNNNQDKLDNQFYNYDKTQLRIFELWSGQHSKNRSELPEFVIQIDGKYKLDIPIKNGFIFGKQDKFQSVTVK